MSAADTWFGQPRRVGVSGLAATDIAIRRCRRRAKAGSGPLSVIEPTPGSVAEQATMRGMNIKLLDDLLSHLADVTIEQVELTGGAVRIWAVPRVRRARCHRCGQPSAKVHNRCPRTLADAAIGGQQVLIPTANPPVLQPPPLLPSPHLRRADPRPDHAACAPRPAGPPAAGGHRVGAGRHIGATRQPQDCALSMRGRMRQRRAAQKRR
jgi:hypothetical protein